MPNFDDNGPSTRLTFLTGVRGLCALTVCLFHATRFSGHSNQTFTTAPAKYLAHFFSYGSLAVDTFIFISGLCISLSIARTPTLKLQGGLVGYLKRRARRILVPYYASLLLSLVFIYLFPALQTPSQTAWDNKLPVSSGAIVSHIFLIHNLSSEWIYRINGPLWSLATEWQLYLLFPLVLLPILRRYGACNLLLASIAISEALRLAPLPSGISFQRIPPEFVMLFTCGILSATIIGRSAPQQSVTKESKTVRLALSAILTISSLYLLLHLGNPSSIYKKFALGLSLSAATVWLASLTNENALKTLSMRALNSRILQFFGFRSYSIYLVHSPVLAWVNLATLPYSHSKDLSFLLVGTLGTSLALIASLVFFEVVEKRFLSSYQRESAK